MIIIGRSVDQHSALSIWQNGLTSTEISRMHPVYDNQNNLIVTGNIVSDINIGNEGFIWAAKHRYELSKFFKTHGNTLINCNGNLAVIKDSYKTVLSSTLSFIGKQIKSGSSPFWVFRNNVNHMIKKEGVFTTTAKAKHLITESTLSKYGYFILIFPSAWAQGNQNLPAPFMINNNFNFLALSGLLGPSIRGIKDQTGKAESFDYFYTDRRETAKMTADIKANQL